MTRYSAEISLFRASASARTGLVLAAVIFLAGCASNTSVSSAWHKGGYKGTRFERVLVVAIVKNTDRRLSFEDAVVYDLRGETTRAWASARLMDTTTKLDAASIESAAQSQRADAVVITRINSLDVQAVEVQGRTDVQAQRQKGTIFRYDYIEKEEAPYITSEYTITLTTDVLEPGSTDPLYTVVATAKKQETLDDVIEVLSDIIARQLRQDGVIN